MAKPVHAETVGRATRRPDPRTARTVEALRRALREALANDPPDRLTVSEICQRAHVRRTTFYTHFDSVEQLLTSTLVARVQHFLAPPFGADAQTTDTDVTNQLGATVLATFRAMSDDRVVFRNGLDSDSSAALRRALTDIFAAQIRTLISLWQNEGRVPDLDTDVIVAYSASGLVGVLDAWCHAPEPEAAPERWLGALDEARAHWWPHRDTAE